MEVPIFNYIIHTYIRTYIHTWEWRLTTGLRLGNTRRTSVANVRQHHVHLPE